jgi:hypothetical protein
MSTDLSTDTHGTPKKDVPEWRDRFLTFLSEHGSITEAAKASGIARITAYRERAIDPVFAEQWKLALDLGVDALEDQAKMRALAMSDTLLIFLLKAHREKYRELPRGALNLNLNLDDLQSMSDDDLERLKQQLA